MPCRSTFKNTSARPCSCCLHNAEAAGAVRGGVDPLDLLGAVANLCIPPPGSDDNSRAYKMVALLIDGLRYGARR